MARRVDAMKNLRKLEGVTGCDTEFPLIGKKYIFSINGKVLSHPVTLRRRRPPNVAGQPSRARDRMISKRKLTRGKQDAM